MHNRPNLPLEEPTLPNRISSCLNIKVELLMLMNVGSTILQYSTVKMCNIIPNLYFFFSYFYDNRDNNSISERHRNYLSECSLFRYVIGIVKKTNTNEMRDTTYSKLSAVGCRT